MELWHLPILVAGGFVCGVLNALAGGGSFVTLPLLLMMGLPPQVANATNRLAIVLQCAGGLVTYQRARVIPWSHVLSLSIPMVLGSLAGAYAAAYLHEEIFTKVMAVLFAAMIVTIFIDPKRWEREHGVGRIRLRLYPIFFLMGAYGGFLQAGVGTLVISVLVLLGGYDVVRGNALKFALALIFTLAAVALFAGAGQVRWGTGLVLAAGSTLGGVIGARLVITKGRRWVRILVILAALAAIAKLLLKG